MGLMPTKFWKVDWKRVSNSVHLGFFLFFFYVFFATSPMGGSPPLPNIWQKWKD